jgi:hypothetical protein
MDIVKSIDTPAFKGTIMSPDPKHGSGTDGIEKGAENSVNVGENVGEEKGRCNKINNP